MIPEEPIEEEVGMVESVATERQINSKERSNMGGQSLMPGTYWLLAKPDTMLSRLREGRLPRSES